MSYIDIEKARMLAGGSNFTEYYKNTMQQRINDSFEMASDVYIVQRENKSTGIFEDITVRVTKVSNPETGATMDDYRKILFKDLNSLIDLGLRFKFGGFSWFVNDTSNIMSVTQSCVVHRCNEILKWKDKNGTTYQYDCSTKLLSNRSIDIKFDNKELESPFGKILVQVPYNSDTSTIQLDQRFLFKQSAYVVVGKDDVSNIVSGNGYLNLILNITQKSSNDDFTNQIADNSVLYGRGSSGSSKSGSDWLK